jgi:methionyl-tRNA synthetase
MALNGFRLLMIFLQPVIPQMATQAQAFFNEKDWSWLELAPLVGVTIEPYQALLNRLQADQWQAMLNDVPKDAE